MLHAFKHLLFDLPWRAVEKFLTDDASLLAAAVAYYFAISLFPLLLVLVAVVGFVLAQTEAGQNAEQYVIEAAANQVSPSVAQQLESLLATVREQAPISGPLGVVLLLAAAMAMFVQLDRAFDLIWEVQSPRAGGIWPAIKRILFVRLKAFVMLVGLWGLVMLGFVAGLVLAGIDDYANRLTPFWSQIKWSLRNGLNLAINIGACTLIFRYLPKRFVAWRDALAGAIVAGVGWEIGRYLLGSYVIGQQYSSAYGVIGSFLAVMLWCYYVIALLFLGAEYAHVMAEDRRPKPPTPEAAIDASI
jgi:membrane protein